MNLCLQGLDTSVIKSIPRAESGKIETQHSRAVGTKKNKIHVGVLKDLFGILLFKKNMLLLQLNLADYWSIALTGERFFQFVAF